MTTTLTTTPERRIIGLSGYPGVGKDTVAKMLHPRGYKRVAFADPIRALALDLDPVVQDQVSTFGWDKVKDHDGYVRRYLQKLGQMARHHLGDGIWVNAALEQVGEFGRYIFTDVRYINEADILKAMGGKIVRVERPGHQAVNSHASEVEMDDYDYDGIIRNEGDLSHLFDLVMAVEENLGW